MTDPIAPEQPGVGPLAELLSEIEPLLCLIGDVLIERHEEITKACEEKRAWQERHNADCHRTGQPRWHYMTEFTRELTDRRLTPLLDADRRANRGYDALAARLPPLLANLDVLLRSLGDCRVHLTPEARSAVDELTAITREAS